MHRLVKANIGNILIATLRIQFNYSMDKVLAQLQQKMEYWKLKTVIQNACDISTTVRTILYMYGPYTVQYTVLTV